MKASPQASFWQDTPPQKKNTTTQKTTLGGRQCLELSAGALTTLLWKGPMLWWLVECSGEGALGYEGLGIIPSFSELE